MITHPEPTADAVLDPASPPERGVFCNRTLNLRAIRAIGYDMDYTLVHYRSEEWERRAYDKVRSKLAAQGLPVSDLEFDHRLVVPGLIIDRALGNIVKANRFGYVKQAAHGTRMLGFDEQRRIYSRTIVDLAELRFKFLNTLFSISEASIYCQLVDLLDTGAVEGVLGYDDLHDRVTQVLDEAHLEGELKAEIMADPERFVVLDPGAAQAILDQHEAGKTLLLITNSEWDYTRFMMAYAFDRYLPGEMTWRDLFELVVFSARKPSFFEGDTPTFRMVEDGLLEPCPHGITVDGVFAAGSAQMVEDYLDCDGSAILFVGDHIYGDVHISKRVRRWRAGLVLRELESEMIAIESFRADQSRLEALMAEKERLERQADRLRLALQRGERGHGPAPDGPANTARLSRLRARLADLDEQIAPLARASGALGNERWGLLLRAGNDKSHLARQIERHADIYTSRVSNLGFATPYAYFRSPRGSMPHDPGHTPDPWDRHADQPAGEE